MTVVQLMQLVLQMQAQARQLGEALAAYHSWLDMPGDNAEHCAVWAFTIAGALAGIGDTLLAEVKAAANGSGEGS